MATTPYYEQASLTRDQIKNDNDFLDDASLVLLERTGKSLDDPDEIIDQIIRRDQLYHISESALRRRNLNDIQRDNLALLEESRKYC